MFNRRLTLAEQRRLANWEKGTAAFETQLAKRRGVRHAFIDNGQGFCADCGVTQDAQFEGRRIHPMNDKRGARHQALAPNKVRCATTPRRNP